MLACHDQVLLKCAQTNGPSASLSGGGLIIPGEWEAPAATMQTATSATVLPALNIMHAFTGWRVGTGRRPGAMLLACYSKMTQVVLLHEAQGMIGGQNHGLCWGTPDDNFRLSYSHSSIEDWKKIAMRKH